ncbi:MAG: ATP-dependent DNA helicase RecG [Hellea sp.]|nr:ATP-dependent DNA helicase RecG [Hellea sp.]
MRPDKLFPYFADVTSLNGVGARVREALERAMGTRLKDLILTPPASLIDRSYRPHIAGARDKEICTFKVSIGSHSPPDNKRYPYKIRVFDDTGDMTLVFFKARSDYLKRVLPEGGKRLISGKVEFYGPTIQMTHPDYILEPAKADELPLYETQYPLTQGLSQKVARKSVMQALDLVPDLPEWLDETMVQQQDWLGFSDSLEHLHKPAHPVDISPTSPIRHRLAYDELLAKQLALALVRESTRKRSGRPLQSAGTYVDDVLGGSPFAPTDAQIRAFVDIKSDMGSRYRMSRLLHGDVGSGKTFVGALACAFAAESQVQTAFMAPTEILARQHAESLKAFLDPACLTVETLTGRDKGRQRQAILSGLKEGYIDVIIGTHALFQEGVDFKDLGLAIIDEQHRFGVHDRLKLMQKGQTPDLLVMTATPIPRTLALTAYGDLDISKLDEKPAGRRPIETRILPLQRMDDVIDAVGRTVASGNQIYWVCPLVEDSDLIDLSSAEERFRELTAHFGTDVGLVHGRLKAEEKDRITQDFKNGGLDILVATTVIEVGVDAPNATVMVIEHAERFGLAQLHQLRGRVGRSDKPSTCLLLYKGPLSVNGKARLEIMRQSDDGFVIAEKDWELRGSGDLLGARQSGLPAYQLADLDKHKALLETAHRDARLIVKRDPGLKTPRGQALRLLLYLFEQDWGIELMHAG